MCPIRVGYHSTILHRTHYHHDRQSYLCRVCGQLWIRQSTWFRLSIRTHHTLRVYCCSSPPSTFCHLSKVSPPCHSFNCLSTHLLKWCHSSTHTCHCRAFYHLSSHHLTCHHCWTSPIPCLTSCLWTMRLLSSACPLPRQSAHGLVCSRHWTHLLSKIHQPTRTYLSHVYCLPSTHRLRMNHPATSNYLNHASYSISIHHHTRGRRPIWSSPYHLINYLSSFLRINYQFSFDIYQDRFYTHFRISPHRRSLRDKFLCPYHVFYYSSIHLLRHFRLHSWLCLSHFFCHQWTLLHTCPHLATASHSSCHVSCHPSKTLCTPCRRPTSSLLLHSWCLWRMYRYTLTWSGPIVKLRVRTLFHLRIHLHKHLRLSRFRCLCRVSCLFRNCLQKYYHLHILKFQIHVFYH